jgi:hypothetical protein
MEDERSSRERRGVSRDRNYLVPPQFPVSAAQSVQKIFAERFGSSVMSNASFTSRPLGTAMVGGALAMAILDILVRKNVLTVDDAQGVLKTAQSSLIDSPAVHGSLDGARIIGEMKDLFARRERGHWSERRG